MGVQLGWAGTLGLAAGDRQSELFTDRHAIQIEDVTAYTRDLRGVREVDTGGGGGPGRPAVDPAMAAFGDDVWGVCVQQRQTSGPYFLLQNGC